MIFWILKYVKILKYISKILSRLFYILCLYLRCLKKILKIFCNFNKTLNFRKIKKVNKNLPKKLKNLQLCLAYCYITQKENMKAEYIEKLFVQKEKNLRKSFFFVMEILRDEKIFFDQSHYAHHHSIDKFFSYKILLP